MFTHIQQQLATLEQTQQIKILYAVESGSRAWGFASQNSDWDVRFIYVHPPEWYLRIDHTPDCIEQMLPNDLDLSGWELQKTLRLFRKSNPSLLEWLYSPIVYQQSGSFLKIMRDVSNKFFSPKNCVIHYYHMARRNWEAYFKTEEVRLKKYLYVLRPVFACMWIERTGTMAPIEFDTLLKEEDINKHLREAINDLLVKKKSGEEMDKGTRIEVIDNFLVDKIRYYDVFLKTAESGNVPGWEELNSMFKDLLNESHSE